MSNCDQFKCPLHGKNIAEPFFSCEPPVDVLVIGIAPGFEEEAEHKVFIGRSGKLLKPYLLASGFTFALGNIVSCRPTDEEGNNRNPEKIEIKNCSTHLLDLVIKAKPKVVLLLGEPAIRTFLEGDPLVKGKIHVSSVRERVFWEGKLPIVCDYHPSFFVRMGEEAYIQANQYYIPTFSLIKTILNGTYVPVKADIQILEDEKDVLCFLGEVAHTKKLVSIDFEYNVNKYDPQKKSLYKNSVKRLCTGIAIDNKTGYCIPEDHKDSPFIGRKFPIAEAIKDKYITSHNITAELLCLDRFDNVDPCGMEFEDSFLMASLLNPDDLGGRDLKTLSSILTPYGGYEKDLDLYFEKLKKQGKDFGNIPLSILAPYCAHDALVARIISEKLLCGIEEKGLLGTYEWLKKKIPILCNITHNGLLFSYKAHTQVKQMLTTQYGSLMSLLQQHPYVTEACRQLQIKEFNVKSPPQCKKLLFDVMGLEILKRNKKTEEPSVDKDTLKTYSHIPVINSLYIGRMCKDTISKYIGPLDSFICEDQRGHPLFNIAGARTGRLCVAKGTFIDMPRDVSKHPKGILIENVKIGDLVYSYDDNLDLCLKRVTWVGCTGEKPVIEINWANTGHTGRTGSLLLTENHEVRMLDGSWVKAKYLEEKDRITALSRTLTLGYPRLHMRKKREIKEHIFILNEILGYNLFGEHSHHKNGNKKDNRIENLERLKQHDHHHLHLPSPEKLKERAKWLHTPEAILKRQLYDQQAVETRSKKVINLHKFKLLRWISLHGSIANIARHVGICAPTISERLHFYGIDIRYCKRRYNNRRKYMSKGLIKRTYLNNKYKHTVKVMKKLRVTGAKLRWLYKEYGLIINNHEVVSINKCYKTVKCYDMEVEDTHCFIANELAVHNSSSAFSIQIIPKTVAMRSMFKAQKGFMLVAVDLGQAELRVLADFSKDETMIKALCEGKDIHQETADALKIERGPAKQVVFGIIYGETARGLARRLNIGETEAEDIMKKLFKKYPGVLQYIQSMRYMVIKSKPIYTPFGRVRTFQYTENTFEAVCRQAVNYPIQSTASDIMLCILEEVWEQLGYRRIYDNINYMDDVKKMPDGLFIIPHAIIHDELLSSCKENDVEEVKERLIQIAQNVKLPFNLRVPIVADAKHARDWGGIQSQK